MKPLNECLSEIFRLPLDSIDEELSIESTACWDSLKHMELIVTIEKTYDVIFDADEIIQMTNVKNIKNILTKKGVNI